MTSNLTFEQRLEGKGVEAAWRQAAGIEGVKESRTK